MFYIDFCVCFRNRLNQNDQYSIARLFTLQLFSALVDAKFIIKLLERE